MEQLPFVQASQAPLVNFWKSTLASRWFTSFCKDSSADSISQLLWHQEPRDYAEIEAMSVYLHHAINEHLPTACQILLWVMHDKPKRVLIYHTSYPFSGISDSVAELEEKKKFPRKLKELKRIHNIIASYTSKYPEYSESFSARADQLIICGLPYLRVGNLKSLAEKVQRVRYELTNFPALRQNYPFQTHLIEHAEDLVPSLTPYMHRKHNI